MAFSQVTIYAAWLKANGRCERCGKELVFDNHQEGERGAWEAHHKTARDVGGSDSLSNCEVLCLDCHKNTSSYGRHR